MADEMSPELLKAMLDLDNKHWDDITEMWHKGQVEKKEYSDLYYKQIDNLNLGNRTFQDDKRTPTPAEKNTEIDDNLLKEVEDRKKNDLEILVEVQELKQEEHLSKFTEVKQSMFSYNRLNQKIDVASPNKEKTERDISEDFE